MSNNSEPGSITSTLYLVFLLLVLFANCCGLLYRYCPLSCCRGGFGMKRKGYIIRGAVPSQPLIQPGMEGNQSVLISGSFPEQPSEYSPQVMEGNQSVVISGSFPEQPSEYSPQVMEGNQSVVISGSFPVQPSQYSRQVMQHNPRPASPHYDNINYPS